MQAGRRILEMALSGIALAGGLWLVEELRSPYSDLRLRLGAVLDQVKGETS